MMRPLVVGNWKMNGTEAESRLLADRLVALLGSGAGGGAGGGSTGGRGVAVTGISGGSAEVALAPPFTSLRTVGEAIRGHAISLAAQNIHPASHGAFTGEISARMLVALGVHYAIVGHSERRRLFHETDADVAARAAAASGAGIVPILCVGEQESERMSGETLRVLDRQVTAGISRLLPASAAGFVIAYEPVWAIGTGRNATPAQVSESHLAIREVLRREAGPATAEATRILYGGSVTAQNAPGLLACDGVDGALVGGASLVAESFAAIVAAAPASG